jgi:hypothetical protein
VWSDAAGVLVQSETKKGSRLGELQRPRRIAVTARARGDRGRWENGLETAILSTVPGPRSRARGRAADPNKGLWTRSSPHARAPGRGRSRIAAPMCPQ